MTMAVEITYTCATVLGVTPECFCAYVSGEMAEEFYCSIASVEGDVSLKVQVKPPIDLPWSTDDVYCSTFIFTLDNLYMNGWRIFWNVLSSTTMGGF